MLRTGLSIKYVTFQGMEGVQESVTFCGRGERYNDYALRKTY